MTPLLWKLAVGFVMRAVLYVAAIAHSMWEISHSMMAPIFALIAAVVHSATLIRGPKEEWMVDLMVRALLVTAVLLSAYHWLLSQATETNQILVQVLAAIGSCATIPQIVMALQERRGSRGNPPNTPGPELCEPKGPD